MQCLSCLLVPQPIVFRVLQYFSFPFLSQFSLSFSARFLAINCVSCSYTHKFHFEICTAVSLQPLTHLASIFLMEDPHSFPKLQPRPKIIKTLRRFPSEYHPKAAIDTHTHTCRYTYVCVCVWHVQHVCYVSRARGECESGTEPAPVHV